MSLSRTFRACHVGKAGRLISVDTFEAVTDAEALRLASRLTTRHRIALCERDRFISSLPPRLALAD